jgi:hypothetical protein
LLRAKTQRAFIPWKEFDADIALLLQQIFQFLCHNGHFPREHLDCRCCGCKTALNLVQLRQV